VGVPEYVHALDKGNEYNDPLSMSDLIYGTKTSHWEHEDEVRFFSGLDRQYIPFDESALSGVVFGAKCSGPLMSKIRDSLDRWQKPPRVFKTSIEKSSHKLWIQKDRIT
jgi:hypothetical protein